MNSRPPQSKGAHLLLLVEDDAEMRVLLQAELESDGFAVITATNGAEALASAAVTTPDVILMDILMPVMDGIEAIRKLKENDRSSHIPILILTVMDNKEKLIEGLQSGALDYITKPFFLPELKARVNAALRSKILYDELVATKEQLIKRKYLNTLQDMIAMMQHINNEMSTVVLGKIDLIRRNDGRASAKDLNDIETSVYQINSTFQQLDIVHFFTSAGRLNVPEVPDCDTV